MKTETTNHSFEPFAPNHTFTTQSKPQSEFVYVSSSQPSAIVMISTQYQSLSDKEKLEMLSKLDEWIDNKQAEIKESLFPVKLYTEKQVIMAMHLTTLTKETYSQVLEQLIPIQLPSDKEIERESEILYPINKGGSMWMPSRYDIDKANKQEGFLEGAKWMKEQIL